MAVTIARPARAAATTLEVGNFQRMRALGRSMLPRPGHWRIHATELHDLCWPSAQDALLVTFGKTKVTPVPGRDNANKPIRNQSCTPHLVIRSAAGKGPVPGMDNANKPLRNESCTPRLVIQSAA